MAFGQNAPIYLQICDKICESVIHNRWGQDDKIPSVRDMAVECQVNPNTIVRSYSWLQEKGIIYNKRGLGYFTAEGAGKLAQDLLRKEFIEKELPLIFHKMELIGISPMDLEGKFKQYNKNSGGKGSSTISEEME